MTGALFRLGLLQTRRNLLLRRRWSRCAPDLSADDFAADDDFDAAVFLTAGWRGVVRNRHGFAEAGGGDGVEVDALLHKEVANGGGALFRQLLVESRRTSGVGVSFDLEFQAWIGNHDAGKFGEGFASGRTQGVRPVSKSTSPMLTIRPRTVSRVSRMRLNWVSRLARNSCLSRSDWAAAAWACCA